MLGMNSASALPSPQWFFDASENDTSSSSLLAQLQQVTGSRQQLCERPEQ